MDNGTGVDRGQGNSEPRSRILCLIGSYRRDTIACGRLGGMGFLVLTIVFGLSVVFLALAGVFGAFPDEWEWAAFVVGAVGIAMSTPSIFAMIWGQPKVSVRIEKYIDGDEHILTIYIENLPVKNRVLKWLGVRRETVQSLVADLRIREVGSGVVLIPILHCRIFSDDDPTDMGRVRTALPPTFSVAASIVIAKWDKGQGKAMIPGDRLRAPILLGVGAYSAVIILYVDGDPMTITRSFMVGQNAADLQWASR